ncbi:MAG: hypothetical protein HY675_00730 [Chloroflexi bacterium]|nr:hypothetical protein [Chloroflexota bacterium]
MTKKSMSARFAAGKQKKTKKKGPRPIVPSTVDQPVSRRFEAPTTTSSGFVPRSVLASVAAKPSRIASGLATDYGYVLSDLRRIAVVAGSMLVILLILFFIIR